MKIVLFGDSYTHGRLPHSQTDGALPNELGLESNCCFAKSGTTAQEWAINKDGMLENVISSDADIAVGSLGGNDLFVALADGNVTFLERIAMMGALYMVLKRISETKKTILMLYPDPFSGTRADAIEAQKQLTMALNLIVSAVNKEKNNIVTLDLSTVLNSSHFDNVDIHPNVEGYKVMAKAITEAVSKLQEGEIK
jgi:lysophospholipase L1-like esterase